MNKRFSHKSALSAALTCLALGAAPAAFSHTSEHDAEHGAKHDAKHDAKHGSGAPVSQEQHSFGQAGNPLKVTRIIAIDMLDTMRFSPSELTIKQGETVKFVMTNKGQIMHELVLGTMDELKSYRDVLRKHPDMAHDEPYMSHVTRGKTEEMVWQFSRPGSFYFACLLPGHFEAGMIGRITVTASR